MEQIIKSLYACQGVINLSDQDDFEVQPGVFAPVYINFKSTLADPEIRQKLAKIISGNIKDKPDCICGIESGGSYYASAVADILNRKVVFFRKVKKEYNIKNRFAGQLPKAGERVLIVDDVISSGNTIAKAVNALKRIGCQVEAIIVFSYCWDKTIARNLGVKVSALSDADELVKYGLTRKKMKPQHAKLIRQYIDREESRLYRDKK